MHTQVAYSFHIHGAEYTPELFTSVTDQVEMLHGVKVHELTATLVATIWSPAQHPGLRVFQGQAERTVDSGKLETNVTIYIHPAR